MAWSFMRLFLLRAISLLFLGRSGWRVDSALHLHPAGEFISDEIRTTRVHYEILNLVRVWILTNPKLVVDVGANIGNHSHFFESKGSDVVAFEPTSGNFSLLQKNLIRGVSHNFALGRDAGEAEMLVSLDSMGNSHIRGAIEIASDPSATSEAVQVRTLDSFELPHVDLLKIDAEGFEMEILAGCEATLGRCRPAIWIEVHEDHTLTSANIQWTRAELLSWMSQRDYENPRKLDSTNFLFFPKK